MKKAEIQQNSNHRNYRKPERTHCNYKVLENYFSLKKS